MVGIMIALTLGFAAGAIFTYRTAGWTWVSVGFALATLVLGVGSVIESLVQRIELTDDAVVVTRLTGERSDFPASRSSVWRKPRACRQRCCSAAASG